jgi:hypothetical protein
MTSKEYQFKLWKNKQKSYNKLYNFSIQLLDNTLPWNDTKLNYQKRFKSWKKNYSSYLETKKIFAQQLNFTIFRNNKSINNLEALEILYSIKKF